MRVRAVEPDLIGEGAGTAGYTEGHMLKSRCQVWSHQGMLIKESKTIDTNLNSAVVWTNDSLVFFYFCVKTRFRIPVKIYIR